MNVFRKCLRKEFGKAKYLDYVQMCEDELARQHPKRLKLEEKIIFKDMYEKLCNKNEDYIKERTDTLTEALTSAIQIGSKFESVLLFYIGGNIVMLALGLNYYVTCVSIALMGACFIYKLVEFLSNKYCFVDAYIIMVYKSVLEKVAGNPNNG